MATTVQTALLTMLGQAQQAEQGWVAELSDNERNQAGTPEAWSAKDMLVHLAFWRNSSIERLAAIERGEEPVDLSDFQTLNERTFEERRALPWERVLADATTAHAALAERVRALDDEVLTSTTLLPWAKGRALVSNILGNSFWHPLEHIARFYTENGEPARGTALMEKLVVNNPSLAAIPQEQGAALYNLACIYATTGQPDLAIRPLSQALKLRPDLLDWSKEDSDLDSLRDRPDFQALYSA